MAQALDYSAGFPGGLNIARPREAGRQKFIGAVRYIGLPDRRKCATRAELDDFSRTGLGMALVFEESSGNWRKGFQQGQYDARRARDHATAIGFPIGRPVYMAIDEDVVTAGEFSSMLEYLRGAQGPLGGSRLTGVYGEADVVDRARDAGVATWIWQTKAWSRGRVTTAHLRQLIGTVTVGGIACDVNDILTADWGQHNYVEDDMTPDQEQKLFIWLEDILRRVQQMHVADGAAIPDQAAPGVVPPWQAGGNYGGLDKRFNAVQTRLDGVLGGITAAHAKLDNLNALTVTLSDDEPNILAAIHALPTAGQPSAEQMDALTAQLKASLGPALADELGRRLQS